MRSMRFYVLSVTMNVCICLSFRSIAIIILIKVQLAIYLTVGWSTPFNITPVSLDYLLSGTKKWSKLVHFPP